MGDWAIQKEWYRMHAIFSHLCSSSSIISLWIRQIDSAAMDRPVSGTPSQNSLALFTAYPGNGKT